MQITTSIASRRGRREILSLTSPLIGLVQPGLVSETRHGDWNLVTCFQVSCCLRPAQPSSLSAPGLRCYTGKFTGSGFLSEPKRRLSQENPWAPERLLDVQPAIAARAE